MCIFRMPIKIVEELSERIGNVAQRSLFERFARVDQLDIDLSDFGILPQS